MLAVNSPKWLRLFSPRYWSCEIPDAENKLFLTFDDGPVPDVTPEVLSVLGKYGVKATFFCIGDNVRKHPGIFEQVRDQGHVIGNHTFSHLNGWRTPPAGYVENVMRCNDYFKTKLFRPPYGSFTPSQYLLLRKQFRFILWSVLTGDFHREVSPEQCLQKALNYSRSGSIIVFHDSVKSIEKVRYALPRFIEAFLGKGFRFEGIGG